MAIEDAFTPRLGKIRDRGAAGGARLRKRVTTTAKQLVGAGRRSAFSGKRLGRGQSSAMHANYAVKRYAAQKMRRVMVKAYIAKPGKIVGAGVFSKHLNYLQRDGVERDGTGGELYSREGRKIDAGAFAERSKRDRHQFRFIVSPEDADKIKDLKAYTRGLMESMERDLGTRLEWVAVDHHNTGRSHTHIVVRGKEPSGKDLIIAPDFISRGLRERASMLATEMLGPRREMEILRQRGREVEQDRFTQIDRSIGRLVLDGKLEVPAASNSKDRFDRALQLQRLKHLESLQLAKKASSSQWLLQPGWQDALKAMGWRGDIIKAISAGLEPGQVPNKVRFIEERPASSGPLTGVVQRQGPIDELRDIRFLLVKDFRGDTWFVRAGALKDGPLPPKGAVVEVHNSKAEPRQSDRTIADIAKRAGGFYSERIHAELDPSSSAAYRLAHKRRLEALRRVGITVRLKDGRWRVDQDFLSRAGAQEAKVGSTGVEVKSWLSIDAQVKAIGETWLDKVDLDALGAKSSGDLKSAKQKRLQHLRKLGILEPDQYVIPDAAVKRMNADEFKAAYDRVSGASERVGKELHAGATFEGIFEGTIDLGQGRFVLMGKSKEFVLVPWRNEMERYRGQSLTIKARHRGIDWSLPGARMRGISR
nr:DUF3363 domain-containing protein [Hyphomonas sp. Mor2]